ncbi:MAG: cysteine desulfurase family protein [Candidatus Berkelbacteria bacterium]|nr:cysteine desulfurase family protein [Candidatus Berkelbacteria bacterium]
MKKIYLDHAATTLVDDNVLKKMLPYFSDKFGNPSSIHGLGQEARFAVDEARRKIAEFLNCKTEEIIFTSGGSESDNLAIRGIIENQISKIKMQNDRVKIEKENQKPHIITSVFEHHAVLQSVKELEEEGKIEATYVKPNRDGIIEVADVEAAIKKNTVLVSIMYVNNEIGTVQPIREIGKMIEKQNQKSKIKDQNIGRIFFHTDAVQAAEYFEMNVDYLHVDLLTLSAHKIYGPKGVGLLYLRDGVEIKQQIVGGGQEYKKRAGTENVAGIVGFGKAVEILNNKSKIINNKNGIENLRNGLIDGLLKIPNSFLNGSREFRSPANVNISFLNAEGESILLNLDMENIAASTGSACTSGSLEPSHVLISMGLHPEQCHGSIRFTLGRSTTKAEIGKVLEVMPKIVEKLRNMSPMK